jgi:4-hydroxyphenylpyruvate dioxygenase-like putative hemolysin
MHTTLREGVPEMPNPLGLDGIEYVEYATSRPQALGDALERMGFRPVARHRSREVVLYRQGRMNLVVNAHPPVEGHTAEDAAPRLSAVAFRVRDAELARTRAVAAGAWELPSLAKTMELLIPAFRGPAGAVFHFVDRYQDFSIFDIDFRPIPTVDPHPPAVAGNDWFGIVQYIGPGRYDDWIHFYQRLFGFMLIPDDQRFGVLPKGKLLASPCKRFMWQLVAPVSELEEFAYEESLERVAIAVPDVAAAVRALRARGVEFVETEHFHADERGALTRMLLPGLAFELVHEIGR